MRPDGEQTQAGNDSLVSLNKGRISSFLFLNLRHALEKPMQFSALFPISVQSPCGRWKQITQDTGEERSLV